jgi:hypothetical protein
VLVLEFVQLGAVFQLGFQVRVVKLGCASRVVQSGGEGVVDFLDSILASPPRR